MSEYRLVHKAAPYPYTGVAPCRQHVALARFSTIAVGTNTQVIAWL